MSGPYRVERRGAFHYVVVGPTSDMNSYHGILSDASAIAISLNAAYAAGRAGGIEKAAKVAEKAYGGPAHTYASENAELYRAQDEACAKIAASIRSLLVQTDKEQT